MVLDHAVVPDESGAARDLSLRRVEQERRLDPVTFREVVDRAEVDTVELLAGERRQDREADDRQRDDGGDHAAEAERGELEEDVPWVARDLLRLRLRHRLGARRALGGGHRRRLHRVAGPEEPEDDGDHGPGDRGRCADDEAGQDARDADGEPDRPDGRSRSVRFVFALRLRDALLSACPRRVYETD